MLERLMVNLYRIFSSKRCSNYSKRCLCVYELYYAPILVMYSHLFCAFMLFFIAIFTYLRGQKYMDSYTSASLCSSAALTSFALL